MEQPTYPKGAFELQQQELGIGESAIQPGSEAAQAEARGPVAANDEAQARADLMQRLNAAAVTRLGQIATVVTAEGVYGLGAGEPDDQAEADSYPWSDAARWRPDGGGPDELALSGAPGQDSEAMDELFRRLPDEQFGSPAGMGWCGLVRHEGRPGGVILAENAYGHRSVWATDSDAELAAQWQQAQQEYAAYQEATGARGAEAASGIAPEIWVGSLADYAAGHLHGVWLDATLEPAELAAAVQFMLRNSYEPGAEEWGIFDYDGFGEAASLLGEYPSLATVSKVAQGIQEHGPAFAAWAAYVGPEQVEQLARFEEHFQGEFDSMEAYVEEVLESMGLYRDLDEALQVLPENLRRYVNVDVEGLARDWGMEMQVVEGPAGLIWVFDTQV